VRLQFSRSRLLGALLVLFALNASADRKEELELLRRVIEEARQRVTAYEARERGLLEAVEALDRSSAVLAIHVARARRKANEARGKLTALEAETEELEVRLATTRRAMSARAVALYKAGDAGAVRMLFSAGGMPEFLTRVQSLRLLLAHDSELLARHQAESDALAQARERAQAAAVRHQEAAARLRERSQQLRDERGVKKRLARQLRSDRARERSALVELETAARALEETLEALRDEPLRRAAPAVGPPFASLRGRLPTPVDAPVARGFGRVVDAEYRTETFRKGIEFDAPLGDSVRAVAPGRVRFAGWFRGYGRLVILDHGDDYFTVSGHLAEMSVEVGDRVDAREPIGTVGDTGSLAGPRLYFEIRQGGVPLDPGDWLKSLDGSRKAG
jgi:septal ring factor EnvC (AmiA/AmiB activator)